MGSGCCSNSDVADDGLLVNTESKHNNHNASQDEVKDWLENINFTYLELYYAKFIKRNYKTLASIATILSIDELTQIGIQPQHTTEIINEIQTLQTHFQSIYHSNPTDANNLIDFQSQQTIKEWLSAPDINLVRYYHNFIQNGYSKFALILSIQNEQELNEIGIKIQSHSQIIMKKIKELNEYGHKSHNNTEECDDIESPQDMHRNMASKLTTYNLNQHSLALQPENVQSLSVISTNGELFRVDGDVTVTRPSWKCEKCGNYNFWNRKRCQLCASSLRQDIIEALKLLSQSNPIWLPSNSSEQQL